MSQRSQSVHQILHGCHGAAGGAPHTRPSVSQLHAESIQEDQHGRMLSSHLHGDDTELIFLIDPDKEGLLFIVEDTTTLGPISLHTSNSQVSVSRHKEEVVINQLLADIFLHACKRIVLASKISWEVLHGVLHQSFNTKTLILGDSRRKTKSIN